MRSTSAKSADWSPGSGEKGPKDILKDLLSFGICYYLLDPLALVCFGTLDYLIVAHVRLFISKKISALCPL